jgi:hypothetical protein
MYHGPHWTNIKLTDVLNDIVKFLSTKDSKEIVIATLTIKDGYWDGVAYTGNWDEDGWKSACLQVKDQLADYFTKSNQQPMARDFGTVTPQKLLEEKRRLVLLKHEDCLVTDEPSAFRAMDREGVYAGTLYPTDTLSKLDSYTVPEYKMWILHLNIPYKGDIGNTMRDRAGWAKDFWLPKFGEEKWKQRRLNIINCDFVDEDRFGWVAPIVALNKTFPKTSG